MLMPILIEDANTVAGFFYNYVIEFTGGDWIFVGIGLLVLVGLLLAMAGVRSGGVIAVGVCFIFVLSLLWGGFVFLFWLAFIAAIFVLIMAFRKKTTGN